MAIPKINISSLDFQSIKNNLIEYLKSTNSFRSYSFNGSAINSLLDVLAYNTLYYGFYTNMIANETFLDTAQLQQNIIGLMKPLGYIVNGVNSSIMSVTVKGSPSIIPYTTSVSGIIGSNSYTFYAIKNYTFINSSEEKEILFYEGTPQTINITVNSTIETDQKYIIADPYIDINTISVTVNGELWSRYDPLLPKYLPTDKIFFIERIDNNFYILFSKLSISDVPGVFGMKVKTGDTIQINHIKPSGSVANGCILSGSVGIVVNSRPSGGGGPPDLDVIKTFVPKLFSANQRAVTKSDYMGLLLELSKDRGLVNNENEMNVWGGEELQPPLYGRLFYSFNNTGLTAGNVKDITSALKERSVMTVTPEYVPSQDLNINVSFGYRGSINSTALKRVIDNYFSTNEFNKEFSLTKTINAINSAVGSGVTTIRITNIYTDALVSRYDFILDSGFNEIDYVRADGVIISGTEFIIRSDSGSNIIYKQQIGSVYRENIGSILNKKTIIFNNAFLSSLTPEFTFNLKMYPVDRTDGYIKASKRHLLQMDSTVIKEG